MWPFTTRKQRTPEARTRTVAEVAVFVDDMAARDLELHVADIKLSDVHAERLAILNAQRRLGELNDMKINWAI